LEHPGYPKRDIETSSHKSRVTGVPLDPTIAALHEVQCLERVPGVLTILEGTSTSRNPIQTIAKPVNNKNLRFEEFHTQESMEPPASISSIFGGHPISSIPGTGKLREIQPVQLRTLPATGVPNPAPN
jgi:hypothetical protein